MQPLYEYYIFSAHNLMHYYKFTISHSYILEQLSSAAPHKLVRLCLALRKDCLPFCVVGLCCPLSLLRWAWSPQLGSPQFLLWTSCLSQRSIHHTFGLNIMGAWYDTHTYIHNLQFFFFLFSFVVFEQVSWPQVLCQEQEHLPTGEWKSSLTFPVKRFDLCKFIYVTQVLRMFYQGNPDVW